MATAQGKRLFSGTLSSASSPQTITCSAVPSGHVYDVTRCLIANNSGSVPFLLELLVNDGSGDRRISPGGVTVEPAPGAYYEDPFSMNAGDVLKIKVTFTGTVNLDYYISGFDEVP